MKRHCLAVVWLLAAALIPAEVSAQLVGSNSPPPDSVRRPYRGLFSGLSTPTTPQSLVFSASLFGAYDDNVVAGLTNRSTNNWRYQESGVYAGAHAGLGYAVAHTGQRVSFGAHANAQARYYRREERSATVPTYGVGGDVGVMLTRSTRLSAGHQFSYSRSYRFTDLPIWDDEGTAIDPALPELDIELFNLGAYRNLSRAGLSQRLSRYSSFSLGYRFRAVDFVGDESLDAGDETATRQLRDYQSQSGSARIQYDRPVTAHATLNLGYGIRVSDGRHGSGEPRTMHDVRAGVTYSRALSISRRTSLGFSTGSAILVIDDLAGVERDLRTRFRLLGNANLTHELGRTWTARLSYYRGVVYREGFDEPFFVDGLSASIGGLVTRRMSASAVARWSLSNLQRSGNTGHSSFAGVAQTTYALTSYLALFANYVYYQYDYDKDVPLDPIFPRALDRQGVRVGVTASVPLIR